jgi:integrase
MSVRRRSKTWYFQFQLDGRTYVRSTGLAATKQNRTKAEQQEQEYKTALTEGRRPSKKLAVREFNDAAAQFLEWAEVEYKHRNSYKRLVTSFASLRAFFDREPVSAIDETRVEAYKLWRRREHDVRPVTARHDLHCLSKFFGYSIKMRWARENPVKKVQIPSDVDAIRIHPLTANEERRSFEAAAKHRDLFDLGRLMVNQGLRPDEVVSLRRQDVDLDRRQLMVAEGKSAAARRTLDLTDESMHILSVRMTGDSEWIFPAPRKRGEHIARLNNQHDKALAETGLAFCLYDLRHTFATRAAQLGIDTPSLAAILGHSSLRIQQRYVHPTAEHKKLAMQRYQKACTNFCTNSESETARFWPNEAEAGRTEEPN